MGFGNARHGGKSTEEHKREDDDSLHLDLTPSLSSLTRAITDSMEARGVKLGKDAQEREAIQQERTAPACPAVMLTGGGVILSTSTWMALALPPSGSQTASRVPSARDLSTGRYETPFVTRSDAVDR